jgi:hypothetical protein
MGGIGLVGVLLFLENRPTKILPSGHDGEYRNGGRGGEACIIISPVPILILLLVFPLFSFYNSPYPSTPHVPPYPHSTTPVPPSPHSTTCVPLILILPLHFPLLLILPHLFPLSILILPLLFPLFPFYHSCSPLCSFNHSCSPLSSFMESSWPWLCLNQWFTAGCLFVWLGTLYDYCIFKSITYRRMHGYPVMDSV